jgi:hypothetical protein
MPGNPPRWIKAPAASYIHRRWPEESEHLVFVPASGELHLLTGPAVSVLEQLSAVPVEIADLAQVTLQPEDAVSTILETLDRLGLAAPCR